MSDTQCTVGTIAVVVVVTGVSSVETEDKQ